MPWEAAGIGGGGGGDIINGKSLAFGCCCVI